MNCYIGADLGTSGLKILLYPMKGFSSNYAIFGTKYGSIDNAYLNEKGEIVAKGSTPTALPRPYEEIIKDIAAETMRVIEKAGCTLDDLRLMRAAVPETVQVKGSGGIRDLDTVLAARKIGATRCGVSATEKIMQEAEARYAAGTLTEEPVGEANTQGGY